LISEGTDIPAVAVVGLCRPTMSMALYLQIVGRGLRPCEGKDKCIILDHVGNIGRHQHPLTQRDWSLEGMKKKRKKKKQEEENEEYYTCESCYFVYEKSEECCPKCGLINEKKKRELKFVQGIAVKDERSLDDFLNIQQGAKVKEQKDCKTLEEHWQFKERKGYKDYWVKHVFEAKVFKEYYDENQKIYEKYPVSFSLFGDDEENENKLEQYKLEEELIIKLNKKYGLNVSIDRSEPIQEQIRNTIDKAWNSFYGLKKLNMKKSYKKSY
jgi:superfamily II DNA or RNA helicase